MKPFHRAAALLSYIEDRWLTDHLELVELLEALRTENVRLAEQLEAEQRVPRFVLPHAVEAVVIAARAWSASFEEEDSDIQLISGYSLMNAVHALEAEADEAEGCPCQGGCHGSLSPCSLSCLVHYSQDHAPDT